MAPDRQVTLNKTLDTPVSLAHPDPLSLIQPGDPNPIPSARLTSLTRNLPLSYLNPPVLPVFGYWTLDVWWWCVFPATQSTQPANNFLLVCLFSYLHFSASSRKGGRPIFWLIPPSQTDCINHQAMIVTFSCQGEWCSRGVVAGQGRGRGRGRGQCGPGPWASRGGRALLLASRPSGDRRREPTWGPGTLSRRLKVANI